MRMLANMTGNLQWETRIAKRLVAEDGEWFDFYWLGKVRERQGFVTESLRLYRRALRSCPPNDRDRDLVETAVQRAARHIGRTPAR